jgi:hypothetical protein
VEVANQSKRAGCTDELDDLLECLAGLANVCTQVDVCGYELGLLTDCVQSYCEVNPAGCAD